MAEATNNKYIPVIGLEIHVELETKSKMFCSCSAEHFGAKPNSNVCPVCLGLPGAMPVPNKKAIEYTFRLAHALNCKLNKKFKFDRKHYFYPDLPKSFQISQYEIPIGERGYLEFYNRKGELKKFNLRRVHLEEDTGRSIHDKDSTYLDYNRSGVPLCEIVTEPEFTDPEDVKSFLEELQNTIKLTGISKAEMEKGSMRVEPSISIRLVAKETDKFVLPNYKVEVKNINSFAFAKYAVEYEIKRQTEQISSGEQPVQETRGYNESKKATVSQRVKENANDYRYFPEPNVPYQDFTNITLDSDKEKAKHLSKNLIDEFIKKYNIEFKDAFVLTRDIETLTFFHRIMAKLDTNLAQKAANAIVNKKIKVNNSKIGIDEFIKELETSLEKKIIDPDLLEQTIKKVIQENPQVVEQYRSGKESVIMFFVGQCMKKLKGQADAKALQEEIKKYLQ